jgi:cell division inhibitor SepF
MNCRQRQRGDFPDSKLSSVLYEKTPAEQGSHIHSNNQFKVVIMQPETFDDARDVCDHLKNKKPVIVNLEHLTKETAQRVIDFLSGSVYAVDGEIQKVSTGIFMIAPSNVEVMGDFKDELKSREYFPGKVSGFFSESGGI